MNPLGGTDSTVAFSRGNLYPAVSVPFGMNAWTPQTGENVDGWTYQYSAIRIRGLKLTHQPSPWINDYGALSLMPVTGELKVREKERAALFSHDREEAHPYGYKVKLMDYGVWAEVAPTSRGAVLRFTFPEDRQGVRRPRRVSEATHGRGTLPTRRSGRCPSRSTRDGAASPASRATTPAACPTTSGTTSSWSSTATSSPRACGTRRTARRKARS